MDNKRPRVSIGMPVYNGERYLATALDSLLAQTLTDFELIISDNASVDRTEEICTTYALRDSRIRNIRNEINRGAHWNFNRVFELATAPYFCWAAHDDIREPRFLERCVEVLDTRPDVVLVHPRTRIIDEDGNLEYLYDPTFRTDSPFPHIRFHDLMRTPHQCTQVLGVYRVSALAKTHLLGPYTSSDNVLLAELSFMGPIKEVPEPLVSYRHHSEQSIYMDRHARMAWSGGSLNARLTLPQWRLFYELVTSIHRSRLPASERALCYGVMMCWPFWYRNWRRMGRDIYNAGISLCQSFLPLGRKTLAAESSNSTSV